MEDLLSPYLYIRGRGTRAKQMDSDAFDTVD
jgi:hypothetical protein